ncbi:MAG: hypothetical protein JSV78_00325 [Phycisphaerales bacterium]|nr:MAG: hypothetical protein JSV78_00325 [Phycisphaerales bacterium]
MPNGRYRGLAGKERVAFKRARFARRAADEWIDEYGDSATMTEVSDRFIPVRHRNPFMATLTVPQGKELVETTCEQLELPFDDRAVEAEKPETFDDVLALPDVAWKPHADGWKAKDESVAVLSGEDKEAGVTNSASIENQSVEQGASASEGEEFTLHRFLFGCLMGGAAAAAILLAFRIVLN